MDASRAAEFDRLVQEILEPHADDGLVTYQFSAPVVFLDLSGGRPGHRMAGLAV
jgi:hypothetical protein